MEELDVLQQNIAENMRRLRKSNNLTYKQAAKALGISLTQYTRTERGTANTSIITIAKTALLYEVSIREIVFGEKLKQTTRSSKFHRDKSLKEKMKELDELSKAEKEIAFKILDLALSKKRINNLLQIIDNAKKQ